MAANTKSVLPLLLLSLVTLALPQSKKKKTLVLPATDSGEAGAQERLLGLRVGGELTVGERGQVARQETGPHGVARGAEGRRDYGGAVRAGRQEVLRPETDLAAGGPRAPSPS